jgi:two-component system, sensor histidine kinase
MALTFSEQRPTLAGTDPEADEQASGRGTQAELPRILMAEDNPINQRVGKLILQRAGFSVDLAADGSAAVEAHRANPYDLILMDCQMPTMDGFEASRQIRQLEKRQPVIIAVTANALAGERERCLQAGMDDYLSKPFQAEHLVSVVQKWIANGRGAA